MPEDRKTADKQPPTPHARPTIPFSHQALPDEPNRSAQRDYDSCRESVRLIIEFVALLFLIWYADSANIQAIANQNAADAAATAARAAVESNRPSIGPEGKE